MSSPATIAETSDTTESGKTLLIIPDGSPLWFTPNPGETEQAPLSWHDEAVFALMEQLPASSFPILIGAPHLRVSELLDGHYNEVFWSQWRRYLQDHSMTVTTRFSEKISWWFGSDEPDAKRFELRFVTREAFYGDRPSPSNGWQSALHRLGFKTPGWNSHQTILQNFQAKKKRVANVVNCEGRPTSITIGSFVDQELATTEYPLDTRSSDTQS